MTFWKWSKTAATNATADSTINWAEGQPPSSVNDSARGMMAAAAKYRDDVSGVILTGGSGAAYTVATNQVFDTLANLNNARLTFTPHAGNSANATLNVDGLGAKPLKLSSGVDIQSGTLLAGTPYTVTYNNSDQAFYLHNLGANAYGIPLGAGMDYWLPVSPSSALVFPFGQPVSRTTYATLFSAIGTLYGAGDGSTTFNLPDKRNRISLPKGDMGGSNSNLITVGNFGGGDPNGLGAKGGNQSNALSTANLPPYTPSGGIINGSITVTPVGAYTAGVDTTNGVLQAAGAVGRFGPLSLNATQGTSSFVGNAQGGSSTAFSIIPPSIVCNYIMRII